MLCNIRDAAHKTLYEEQLAKVIQALQHQKTLPKASRVGGLVEEKLIKLKKVLEKEIDKYEKIESL